MRLAVTITRPLETFVFKHKTGSVRNSLLPNVVRKYSNGQTFGKANSRVKKLLLAGSFAVTGVTLTTIYHRWSPYWFTLQAASGLDFRRPEIEPTKRILVETDNSGLNLTLFQFQTCPFCCKVRALLDYYGMSYNIVEVNSVTKKQIKWSDYRKVPIVVVEGVGESGFVQLNDSSVIISALESWRLDPKQSIDKLKECYVCIETEENGKTIVEYPNKYFIMYMDNGKSAVTLDEQKEERTWRIWADNHLVHMLSPNIYRTPSESLQAFRYFSVVGEWEKSFSTPERLLVIYTGAVVMYFLSKMLKKKYNLKEDVRESLFDACKDWTKAVGRKRKFMGGEQPNLADLAVYGVLNSIEGCASFEEAQNHSPGLGAWYRQMRVAVQSHSGAHPLNQARTLTASNQA